LNFEQPKGVERLESDSKTGHSKSQELTFETREEKGRKSENCNHCDSAEKPQECFDRLSMNGKISNDFDCSSVRPEVLEG